jgi:23S rRNA (cytidine1920-2'-O)/16S rRNA (cytidine1409-2'-O)-methyltransferase
VAQLEGRIAFSPGAELVALVKPQFELGLARPPRSGQVLLEAARAASAGIEGAGWDVTCTTPSPVTGRHGAVEFLLHARWRATGAR